MGDFAKVRIESDGTPLSTRVWIGDTEVTTCINGLVYEQPANGLGKVTLTAIYPKRVELDGIVELNILPKPEAAEDDGA